MYHYNPTTLYGNIMLNLRILQAKLYRLVIKPSVEYINTNLETTKVIY